MARRITKTQGKGLGVLALIAIPAFGIMKIFEVVGWIIPLVIVVGAIAIFFWFEHDKKQKRLCYLREKYNREEVVQKILKGYFWQGQSEEELRDALGLPVAVDAKTLKTKKRDIWKYSHEGANRFALRITVEDGYVTGWEQKN